MEQIVDDRNTTQAEAQEMLENLIDNGFDGDVEQAALVLGRPSDELVDMIDGNENIDDDLAMKIRGIAEERDIEI